jgi:hypothetical protein
VYTQRSRGLTRLPHHVYDIKWLSSERWRRFSGVARAAGGLLLATAITILGGQIVGALFGVSHPANPITPGGPTPQDLEAFFAIGVVAIGLIVSSRRMVPGSLILLGGVIAFWTAIPELGQMAVLFGLPGGVNLATWFVNRLKEAHHHVEDADQTHRSRMHQRAHRTTHLPIGLF